MTKAIFWSTALSLGFALPATAAAQTAPNGTPCAPGSWFCNPAPEQPKSAAAPAEHLDPLPDPDEAPPPGEAPPPPPPRPRRPPPAIVYQPPPPPPPLYGPPGGPPPYEYGHPTAPISRAREWGLSLHAEGALIGHGDGSAGMGGAGAGIRYKPNRRFGLEADLDFVGGTDYQDDHRNETAFTINGLFYLNPQSRAQLYLLAGFGWSGAHVTCNPGDSCTNGPLDRHYTYFGGQIGGGLELRLTRAIALNVDLRGFIRTRIDDQADSEPEFVDSYGRTSNTSGGGLITGGMVIYF